MKTKKMVTCAMMLAIASVLSMLKPFALPFGGGITLASMMPICLIAYIYGTKIGLLSAFVYSIIQMLLDPGVIGAAFLPGDEQMLLSKAILMCLLDYTLAFTVIGLGGIFKGRLKTDFAAITLGTFLVTGLRYLCHILSGYILWGSYAEGFFSQEGFYQIGQNILNTFSGQGLVIIYTLFYNGLYMIPEIIITTIVTPLIYEALKKGKAI